MNFVPGVSYFPQLIYYTHCMGIIKGLNEKQREAVLTTEGPVLVIAGAGSGKTRLLTHRIAYLIHGKKISPRNILAVTFTNKAAEEMKERVKKLLGRDFGIQPMVGTFHHLCVRILRREIDKIGFSKNFVIFDEADQLALIKKIMKEKGVSREQFHPRALLAVISQAKNELQRVEDFIKGESYFEEVTAKIYEGYQKRLKENNGLDFDDLIQYAVEIFKNYPQTLRKYQDIFRYILVDEYQDTNKSQYVLVNLLAQKHRNLCVVGDDWQSVYSFRGADVRNILDFEKDYPEAKVIKLEQNYRSTQKILDAAYGIISKNIHRKDKKLWTDNAGKHKVIIYQARDESDEAEFIVSEIKKISERDGVGLNDFVVLYRTNAQSRALEEAFLRKALPYRIVGGVRFYERREVKDFLAYLRLISNPNDSVSLERVVNLPPRGIGKATFRKWTDFARAENLNLIQAAEQAVKIARLADSKARALCRFGQFVRKAQREILKMNLLDFMDFIFAESGYQKMLLNEGDVGRIRYENVREIFTVAEKYKDLKGLEGLSRFLEEAALVSSSNEVDQSQQSVHLMTLHSAKGLEFDTVFIAGMEDGLFPHSRSLIDPQDMEEERRLCYVGITRAKRRVYLLWTAVRNIFGSARVNVASRFLADIPDELADNINDEEEEKESKKEEEDGFLKVDFKDGERVLHKSFGEGIVISAKEDLVTVAFKKAGVKKLSARVAPLRKI